MGESAGFEEKEFEVLANASFMFGAQAGGAPLPVLFSPGQVLERRLGFDFSIYLNPSSRTYRLLFGAFPGHVVTPGTANPNPHLLNQYPVLGTVNTFIQYKRPEFFKPTHRQSVWPGEAFLRFSVRSRYQVGGQKREDHRQLIALDELASSVHGVKVRYACPSVWVKEDLYAQYRAQTLIKKCSFVDPRNLSIANGVTHMGWHDFWTFKAGDPSQACGNPGGPLHESETGARFLEEFGDAEFSESREFDDSISELKSFSDDTLKYSEFFHAESGERGSTKEQVVLESRNNVANDFLEEPWRETWHVGRRYPDVELDPRPPRGDELEFIQATVQVAATSRELGLVWLVAGR